MLRNHELGPTLHELVIKKTIELDDRQILKEAQSWMERKKRRLIWALRDGLRAVLLDIDETRLINRKNIIVAVLIQGPIIKNMIKTATEDAKGAEKENLTTTEREPKRERG